MIFTDAMLCVCPDRDMKIPLSLRDISGFQTAVRFFVRFFGFSEV